MVFTQLLRDAVSLLFPELCAGCNRSLVSQERVLCTACTYQLPITNFHLDPENLAAKSFMGRVQVQAASSFLYFSYGSIVQRVIHSIKYKNGFDAAELLGELYGSYLKDVSVFSDCDVIVPVPLHKRRLRFRGYNQSEYFGRGLSKALQIPQNTTDLQRIVYTDSQTKRHSRFNRFENMKDVFQVKDPEVFQGKRILLIDDVLTTGATLEACAATLLEIPSVQVSIATIAYTK